MVEPSVTLPSDEDKTSLRELVDEGHIDLEEKEGDARPEVPDLPGPMSGDDPLKPKNQEKEAEDEEKRSLWTFEWDEDEETFNFGRLIFQDGVQDGAKLHDELYVRMRTLTAKERNGLPAERDAYRLLKVRKEAEDKGEKPPLVLPVQDMAPTILQAVQELTPFAIRRHVVSINGEPIPGQDLEGQIDRILAWPDIFVQMLAEMTNELTARSRELAQTGKVKNF